MKKMSVRVVNKILEAEDIFSFELVDVDGKALPPFNAGAHIDILLPGGLVRQYSLCNDPTERHRYLIAVLRDPNSRGGSVAMHELIKTNDFLQISEPRNHFKLKPAQKQLLLAGGIGVTPIICMAEELSRSGRDFEMHYCSRSVERTAFKARIEQSVYADRVYLHHDMGPEQQRFDVNRLLAQPEPGTHLYVCGPAGFISNVVKTAKRYAWPDDQVHREFFTAIATKNEVGSEFQVRVSSTGMTYAVPADKTVIEILSANGVDVPISCESGICGTCLTRIKEGIPDHRDVYMTDAEHARNDQFTPCCSRSKSPTLVLDL